MNLSDIVILKDKRTNCWSISTTVRIADYCDRFELFGKDNKLEEQRPLLEGAKYYGHINVLGE